MPDWAHVGCAGGRSEGRSAGRVRRAGRPVYRRAVPRGHGLMTGIRTRRRLFSVRPHGRSDHSRPRAVRINAAACSLVHRHAKSSQRAPAGSRRRPPAGGAACGAERPRLRDPVKPGPAGGGGPWMLFGRGDAISGRTTTTTKGRLHVGRPSSGLGSDLAWLWSGNPPGAHFSLVRAGAFLQLLFEPEREDDQS